MEQTELQKIYEEIESLKTRVTALESIINGCAPKQAGRSHKLSLEQRAEIIQKHNKQHLPWQIRFVCARKGYCVYSHTP